LIEKNISNPLRPQRGDRFLQALNENKKPSAELQRVIHYLVGFAPLRTNTTKIQFYIKNAMKKEEKRGGLRPFSGRKKADYTTTILAFRVRSEIANELKINIKKEIERLEAALLKKTN